MQGNPLFFVYPAHSSVNGLTIFLMFVPVHEGCGNLKKSGILIRVGSRKTGYWKVIVNR